MWGKGYVFIGENYESGKIVYTSLEVWYGVCECVTSENNAQDATFLTIFIIFTIYTR